MTEYKLQDLTRLIGTAQVYIFYLILSGISFAVHPNLLSLNISDDIQLIQGAP